jgi:hypothetical protein
MATNNPDGTKAHLKFLFTAAFDHGFRVQQTQDDKSASDPERSAFFDVLRAIEQGKRLDCFWLTGEGHTYCVRLTDGAFAVDGVPFATHEEDLENFRILYFRVRDTHFNTDQDVLGHEIAYRIGFQANVKGTGENIQRWIELR